jgi:hypothetical protein
MSHQTVRRAARLCRWGIGVGCPESHAIEMFEAVAGDTPPLTPAAAPGRTTGLWDGDCLRRPAPKGCVAVPS